jgi:hypothetical protein
VTSDALVGRSESSFGNAESDRRQAKLCRDAVGAEAIAAFLERLAAEMGVRGQSRSKETKCFSDGKEARFAPTAVSVIRAAPLRMPSMRKRSPPQKRQSVAAKPGTEVEPNMVTLQSLSTLIDVIP